MSSSGSKVPDYIRISEVSSMEGSWILRSKENGENLLNLKETELRLGLPGSESPERRTELCLLGPSGAEDKSKIFLCPSMTSGSVVRKGFLGTVDGSKLTPDDKWAFTNLIGLKSGMKQPVGQKCRTIGGVQNPPSFHSPRACSTGKTLTATHGNQAADSVTSVKGVTVRDRPYESNTPAADVLPMAHATKAQVVGWPPIRSYRKNTMAANPTKNVEAEEKSCSHCLYVKVSMDGAPYLRKIDLRNYHTYQELSEALDKMFSCFTIGKCGSGGVGTEGLSESILVDLLHGSECALTYEDKDGDWMLVGDVPWE
ncbi:unnamed protein product [Victoria cruziana]